VKSRRIAAYLLLLALASSASACATTGAPSSTAGGKPIVGGTVTFAEAPGSPPNYIFPLDSLQYFNTSNINQFQNLMWRPLYFFGQGSNVILNEPLSLAEPPVYSNNDSRVTIHLKAVRWSDGEPLTARDVTFWINLLRANKNDWGEYAPGYFPDDVTSVTTRGESTIVLDLAGRVNPTWFTFNELSQIVPIPQQAWDRTSPNGPIGNYDETQAGARAVYKFLNAQSMDLNTYATNRLWQIVDGPWRLASFSPDGYAVFVPNKHYFGHKPTLAKFVEVPYTSESAEYDALRYGSLTYGYVPISDLGQKALLESQGFQIVSWYLWSMNIIPMNFNNPVQGPLYRQTYIRQAMQRLINERQLESAVLDGYGITDNGPIPNGPSTQYVDATVKAAPLGYSLAAAKSLLRSHGWRQGAGGVAMCERPGVGGGECGAGIKAGTPLQFTMVYAAGVATISQEAQALKSSFSQAGINLTLTQEPAAQVYAAAVPCTSHQSDCSWGMAYWGNGWEFSPDNYPSGEVAFATGAVGNFGSYSNAKMDALIKATTTEPGSAPLDVWQNYTAEQLPMLFMPVSPVQVSAISMKLHGAVPQPVDGLTLTPEFWWLSK
jgi:peptide/nickel transport system substrate-binding protein